MVQCPCGTWIIRAQHEQYFEKQWIDQIDKAHEDLHLIADDVRQKYQNDEIDSAREGLTEIQAAFDKMNALINEYLINGPLH